MKKALYTTIAVLSCTALLSGCFGGGTSSRTDETLDARVAAQAPAGANRFNPWMQNTLPNTRELSTDGRVMVGGMGGTAQSIQGEAAHRAHWKEELYPVVYGNRQAPHEILVLLDFAAPDSEKVWAQVHKAARSLPGDPAKIVVFGNSRENYGTDLMGLAIWLSYSRPSQAMPYLDYALQSWNAVKDAQRKTRGKAVPFRTEYDATAKASDFPIHYSYFSRLNPPVPAAQQPDVARYCYDAGNVNMYQAAQLSRYYGVKTLPAVIVDGRLLQDDPDADDILSALK